MTTDTVIAQIVADKRIEVEARKAQEPLDALKRRQDRIATPQYSLVQAILEGPRGPSTGGKRLQLIAEIKKATPSKGRLVQTLEHRAVARTYTIGGACAISVLTESKYFQGSINFLSDCRVSIDGYYPGGRPAMLRKDFIFDPYQVWEARAYGADAILLIVSILTEDELPALVALAHQLQLECLVEVAGEAEVERALKVESDVIGINNRDLKTFAVDLAVTERLRPLNPTDRVVAALSGVHTRADAERMARAGVHAVLVGEALMTAPDVREKMREFLHLMLIVQMHGLPGSGKSTVARALGAELRAIVLDKDVIKAAMLTRGISEALAAPGAYDVHFDLADALVRQGYALILDNPVFWPEVEQRWRALCARHGAPLLMVECLCPDPVELERRIGTRDALASQSRVPFPPRPADAFEPSCERLTLDTTRPFDDLIADALAYIRAGVPA